MSSKLKPSNRRTSPRIPTMLKIEYSLGGEIFSNYSTNISENGLFLHIRQNMETGNRIHLRLKLPGQTAPIQALGKVMWVHRGGQGNPVLPGAGVLFQYISPDHRSILNDFLEQFG